MKVLKDQLLVQDTKEVGTVKVGKINLVLSEDHDEATMTCKVVAVGPECRDVKKGMIVLVPRYKAKIFLYNKEKFFNIKEEELLAILD